MDFQVREPVSPFLELLKNQSIIELQITTGIYRPTKNISVISGLNGRKYLILILMQKVKIHM